MKKPTDPQILELLLKEINHTANSLANSLNYSSASSIYHILNGINNISEGFITRVITKFPNVNYLFLKKGELPILLEVGTMQAQKNTLSSGPTFDDMPTILKNIELLLASIDKKMGNKEE